VGVVITMAIASCSNLNTAAGGKQPIELTLVSFAVTRAAYKNIIPQFVTQWKQEHNQDVKISQSYGGSGSQSRAVIDGLEADIVNLALALDVKKIEKAGLINSGWEKSTPNNGIVTKSVGVIVTRKGNPKNIKTWTDLAQNNVGVITANPKTSGGARWNFLALWGAISQTVGNESQSLDFTTKVYQNVPILPRDAREASDVFFNQEQGDALINYENEVILAGLKGKKLPYIVPDINISIDNPVAIINKNVTKHKNQEVVEAFMQFLFTPQAQKEFAKVGFRSINADVEKQFAPQHPPIKNLFTVEDLGGWSKIQKQFFDDGAIFDQIQSNLNKK
ncbi:MAG TPA: sulfate ABC transporter substrate-binding protein, partial [Allocoleopsis sp.]